MGYEKKWREKKVVTVITSIPLEFWHLILCYIYWMRLAALERYMRHWTKVREWCVGRQRGSEEVVLAICCNR